MFPVLNFAAPFPWFEDTAKFKRKNVSNDYIEYFFDRLKWKKLIYFIPSIL